MPKILLAGTFGSAIVGVVTDHEIAALIGVLTMMGTSLAWLVRIVSKYAASMETIDVLRNEMERHGQKLDALADRANSAFQRAEELSARVDRVQHHCELMHSGPSRKG